MIFWIRFPFLRYAIFLILGIIFFEQIPVIGEYPFTVFVCTACLLVLSFLLRGRIQVLYGFRGVIILFAIFFIGGVVTKYNDHSTSLLHYTNYEQVRGFKAQIISDHNDRLKYLRYKVKVLSVFDSASHKATGHLFIYVRKDSSNNVTFEYGDILDIVGGYYPVPHPQNPHEFNYRKYLQNENIFAHSFIDHTDISKVGYHNTNPLLSLSYSVRSWARSEIEKNIHFDRERAISMALIIGVKDHLDEVTKRNYSSAGAMHVLAVSGLHVGIVYYIFTLLFSCIKRFKLGSLFFVLATIASIWFYALITGFTPSVLRASTMFSIILISQNTGRKSNIYNSLGIAAFILLLINPGYIYSVGFQLSFIAVFGIVFLHPIFYRLLYTRFKIIDYLWSITCVSLAAQAATFPLTLYYFHQFPTYFLISNLLVIPAAMCMLSLGLVMLAFVVFSSFIATWIGFFLTRIAWLVNEGIALLQALPNPIVDWLYYDQVDTLFVYAIVILGAVGLSRKSAVLIFGGLSLCLIFNVRAAILSHQRLHQSSLVFYEIANHIAFDKIEGTKARLYIDSWNESEAERIGFQINPNRLARGLQPVEQTWIIMENSPMAVKTSLGTVFTFRDQQILIYEPQERAILEEKLQFDVIYLDVFVEKLMSHLEGAQILIGSNWKPWQIEKFKRSNPSLPIHSLTEDGYYAI